MDLCPLCKHREISTQVCRKCFDRIGDSLRSLPQMFDQAEKELVPGSTGTGGGTETSIGVRVGALDLVQGAGILETLGSWARAWREDGISDPATLEFVCDINYHRDDAVNSTGVNRHEPDARISAPDAGYSAFHATLRRYAAGTKAPVRVALRAVVDELLMGLFEACKRHPGITDFAADIGRLHAQATAASRTAPRQAWIVECPAQTDDVRCGTALKITGEDYGGVVVCPRCRTHWDVQRLLLVVASDDGSALWLPAEEIELLLGVKERDLRRMIPKEERQGGRYSIETVRSALSRQALKKGA